MENTSVILPSGCYRVEKILGVSVEKDNARSFKVQLVPSWVTESNVVGCEKMISDFFKEQQEKVVRTADPSTRFSNQLKVEDDVCHVQESFESSCDEDVHFHSNKNFTPFKDLSIDISSPLIASLKQSDRNIVRDSGNVQSPDSETQNSTRQQHQSEQSPLQESLPYNLQQQQQQQQLPLQLEEEEQQEEQQQQQQEQQQQNQPSYEFLISFYMENVEHIKDCMACKLQKLGHNQGGPLSNNYEEEEIFQPYTSGHSMFLHVANSIIERRDLMSKGNNKIERIKAVEDLIALLNIKKTIENTQRISKRLGKLINSKKHELKIKRNAAKLGISYNRYRSNYAKIRCKNVENNQSEVAGVSTITSNKVPSQDANL